MTLCSEPGFQGQRAVFEQDVAQLPAAFVGRVSSVIFERAANSSEDGEWELQGHAVGLRIVHLPPISGSFVASGSSG